MCVHIRVALAAFAAGTRDAGPGGRRKSPPFICIWFDSSFYLSFSLRFSFCIHFILYFSMFMFIFLHCSSFIFHWKWGFPPLSLPCRGAFFVFFVVFWGICWRKIQMFSNFQFAPTRLREKYVIGLVKLFTLASRVLLYDQTGSSYEHFFRKIETWSQCRILLFWTHT